MTEIFFILWYMKNSPDTGEDAPTKGYEFPRWKRIPRDLWWWSSASKTTWMTEMSRTNESTGPRTLAS
jgi:hypothetical protein